MRVSWEKFHRAILCAFLFCLPTVTLAETLAMPDREGLVGEDIVVWGVTDQVGNYTLDCGNGSGSGSNPVTDRSYIAFVCNYASAGTFTATLTVGAESDTAAVGVFDPAAIDDFTERGVRINMAIEDGLRFLWTNQVNRAANFPAGTTTEWPGRWSNPYTSLVVLAFENQGYRLSNDNVAPTGIYEKYIVQRGINRILTNLSTIPLGLQAAGNPCVGVPIDGDECTGLYENRHDEFHQSYSTGVATLALAGSGALARINNEVAGYTNGKTYGEILQRMANALVFGQIEPGLGFPAGSGRGGWFYNFNNTSSDGSTVGWVLLGLLDAEAAGITVPAFAKTEHAFAVNGSLNNDGSYDYQSDGNPASNNSVGMEKGGVGLQSLFYMGELTGSRVDAVEQYLSERWNGGPSRIFSTSWGCGASGQYFLPPYDNNHGCAYSMYNAFKGLKLIGTQTLPGVGRPAGPGAIPANDWHEDYKDWLVANQTNPTSTTGGNWSTMLFSSIDNQPAANAAIAELILSPVALVFPDPVTFGEIGLQHCLDGVPCTDRTPTVDGEPTEDTNPVGTAHNVVARALSINGDPIPGTTINIDILSGPNAPQNFQGVSNTAGEVQIEYTSEGTTGTDEIQASIGNLTSNVLTKIWEDDAQPQKCDIDGDGDIDRNDINVIFGLRGTTSPPSDPLADLDDNGIININDGRGCVLLCTLPRCASPPN